MKKFPAFSSIFFSAILSSAVFCATIFFPKTVMADYSKHEKAQAVIDVLVSQHSFNAEEVKTILASASTEQRILDSMANAAEKTKTWTAYRTSFLRESRIRNGAEFFHTHRALFKQAEQDYGVSAWVITAILGVETSYGGYTGQANVLNALATLAFDHPRRGRYFSSELVEYLVLAREQGWDPSAQLGSYAGAMGMAQFMPSNYRKLAVDGNADGDVNLFHVQDAIPSVANYLRHHGWQPGELIATRAAVRKDFDETLIGKGLKPNHSIDKLEEGGFYSQKKVDASRKARVIRFNDDDGDEFWLGLQNFYSISRYNPRSKYAMAVYLLSEEIRAQYTRSYAKSEKVVALDGEH